MERDRARVGAYDSCTSLLYEHEFFVFVLYEHDATVARTLDTIVNIEAT